MTLAVEKKFAVEVVYNGVTKSLQVEPEERVTAVLQRAIALFGVTQNPHLLSLFREDGTVVDENQSVEQAGLKPGEELLLRPNALKWRVMFCPPLSKCYGTAARTNANVPFTGLGPTLTEPWTVLSTRPIRGLPSATKSRTVG